MLKHFLVNEQAQDLIEYTLLLSFVCLATAALFISSGGVFPESGLLRIPI